MNSDEHQTPGLGLPPPASDQSVPNAVGQDQSSIPVPQVVNQNADQLDQEWVSKAKDIVDKTKNDPFLQSRELSKVRAGFLKARYNKDIKVSEDHD